jgi:hypothetical protein
MIGAANVFDFLRQSSCVGLWEHYKDRPKWRGHPEGPVPQLVFDGDRDPGLCMKSVDNLFPYAAAHMHRKHDAVDLREVGAWKWLFTASMCVLLMLQRMTQGVRLGLSVGMFLALGDFDSLSFLNTMNLDYSVAAASFLAAGGCIVLIVRESAPRWRDLAFPSLMILWLGLSKQQYGGLALVLAALTAATVARYWKQWAKAATILAVGVAAPLSFNALNARQDGLVGAANAANKTDTFLWAVLPNAQDADAALTILGLPGACRAAIGKNWYTPGLQAHHPCQAAVDTSRWRLLPLFAYEPATFFAPVARGVRETQPPAADDLKRFESPADASSLKARVLRDTSLSTMLSLLPAGFYAFIVYAAMACGLACSTALLARSMAIRRSTLGPCAMLGIGGIIVLYAVVSSVFGDGYQDVRRHGLALLPGMALVLAGLACRGRVPAT